MAKRTPQQVLDAIDAWDDAAIDAEVEAQTDAEMEAEMQRVLAMTPEQREAELRAAGVDVEADKAKGREAYEKAQRGEAPVPLPVPAAPAKRTEPAATNGSGNGKGAPAGVVIPMSRVRSRAWRWGAGLAAAAAMGGVYASTLVQPGLTGSGSGTGYAQQRRHDAEEACAHSRWSECLRALDDADRAAPEGANDPRERELRRAAHAGLGSPGEEKPR